MSFRPPLIDLAPADAAHLEWARRIAQEGWGQVHPNPMVGCVLVNEGKVVGEGFHEVFGGPHAEIVALEQALSRAEGATAYVSLEPCNHHGKTPPCAQALVDAGVKRVVFGARDPGASSGGGAETLRASGLEVVGPVWDEGTARSENPAFFHVARHDRPFVALKLAMSLDARIAAAPGERTRITGTEAEREVHRIRTGFDAVMVGQGTVAADDPRLTPRLVPSGREPVRRILLLSEADLSPDAAVLADVERHPVHVFCLDTTSEVALERLEATGAHVHPVPADPEDDGLVDLRAVLSRCHELGMDAVLCEGGADLSANLLRQGLVDRLYLLIAPRALGGAGLPAFADDADAVAWEGYLPACPPVAVGSDTLITLDRHVD